MSTPSSIAHYRIGAKLGEGGMGAVYRATDTKLNREVAIKVLPEAFAQDPDRMARFEREAQLLAALNHPNIAAIYGVEQGALVMELVEGEDLKGPLPFATALNYARQIAVALEAAHEKGIIHRDLKPANIKVTPEGVVKLLDFGLAKATEESSGVAASPTISPTISLTMTQAGVILGTAAYMSPEQARGKPVDRRADIWAFGVVLFEMLAGRLLFGGDTLTDTIASVVKTEPDWGALPPDTPPHIRWLLERCLRKDLRTRLQAMGDARMLMEEPPVAAGQRVAESRTPRWLPLIATALAVASATAAGMWWFRAKPAAPVTTRFVLSLPDGTLGPVANFAPQTVPSPDGRYLAFVARDAKTSKSYLWVRPLGSLSAQRFDRAEEANFPFWSPDGQSIGYFADHKLKKIALSGGGAQTIFEIATGDGDGGTWNQSGVIVFAPAFQGALMRVAAAGGPATPVTTLDTNRGEFGHSWPQFLPDGSHFIYLARSRDPEKNAIYVQELGAPKGKLILKSIARAAFAPPGYLLFARDATLYAQRLDLKAFQVQGDPVPVAEEISVNPINGRAAFAVSSNNLLVYRGATPASRQLTWYDRAGKRLSVVGDPGEYTMLRVSPDEKYVALQRRVGAVGQDTWVMDLGTGILTRTTSNLRQTYPGPVWSPDSRRMVLSLEQGGLTEMVVASRAMTVLASDRTTITANDWSPDGKFLLCTNSTQFQVLLLPLSPEGAGGERKLQTIFDTPYQKYGLRLSPDGHWVSYTSDESGQFETYVASFPSFEGNHRISAHGGFYPYWSKDGKELFFAATAGLVMAAEVKPGSKLEVGIPKPLFKINVGGFGQFAVSGDGKRFLVNELIGQQNEGEITVVLNWMSDLKP